MFFFLGGYFLDCPFQDDLRGGTSLLRSSSLKEGRNNGGRKEGGKKKLSFLSLNRNVRLQQPPVSLKHLPHPCHPPPFLQTVLFS